MKDSPSCSWKTLSPAHERHSHLHNISLFLSGSAKGGSGIPLYPKKIRQNTQKYPRFIQIYLKLYPGILYTWNSKKVIYRIPDLKAAVYRIPKNPGPPCSVVSLSTGVHQQRLAIYQMKIYCHVFLLRFITFYCLFDQRNVHAMRENNKTANISSLKFIRLLRVVFSSQQLREG